MDYSLFLKHSPSVKAFFDKETNTVSYIVADRVSKKCAVIDSVLNYEPHSATVSYESADEIISYIQKNNFTIEWILETHIHADHLTAARYIKQKLGGKIAISKSIEEVQNIFGDIFYEDNSFSRVESSFDYLFEADEEFFVGDVPARALYVPGHTPADIAYVIGDAVFVGDTIFMPDYGSARCDFPGGSSSLLYVSVQKIYTLPNKMRLFVCHDYLPENRKEYAWETTIGEEKKNNIHLSEKVEQAEFVSMRTQRDQKLGMPKLIIPSLQVNLCGGDLPKNSNGDMYLKIPVNNIFSKK